MQLSDAVVLVTGASAGIGRAAAVRFAAQGARVLVHEAFGRVDVLVNNAGFGFSGPLTAMPVEQIRLLVEVDLVAAIELTRALLPRMVEHKRSAVCFVTSIAGRTGVAGEAVYAATKAGLDTFAESLRAETAGSGVDVSVVVPGVVDTGFRFGEPVRSRT